jgi:hypothetical protein
MDILAAMSGGGGAPAAGEPRGKIKGSGIQPFIVWYTSQWGHGRLVAAAERMPPELRAGFDLRDPHLGVLPSQWFAAGPIHTLLDNLLEGHTPEQRQRIAHDGARAIIESTLKGVYRWLFEMMMTPERYGRSAHKLFSRYYEPGTMVKTPLGDRGHLSVVTNWVSHHPLLCDFLIHTAEYVYGGLGCKQVQVRRTACISEGAGDCRFEITWSA